MLSLPSVVTFSDGSTFTYYYDAEGNKVRVIYSITGKTSLQRNYSNGVIYDNGRQQCLITEEGYIALQENNKYYYYLKDHQGNNRVVVDEDENIVEVNHYYPFGGVFEPTGDVQRYKYNGKEYIADGGLNWYDYGARHYDPAIGRLTTMDPLAEKYYSTSLYAYCDNNPVKYVDPTGMFASPIYDEKGNLLGTDDKGLKGSAIIMNETNFKQGMSHKEALKLNIGFDGLIDENAKMNLLQSFNSLPDRPDYDGYLTKKEADEWWLGKSGEPLFVDQSKIELHGISTSSFIKNNPIYKNFIWGLTNTGKVYGTLKMTLIDAKQGKVLIGDKYLDEYDFKMDGRPFRDFATWVGRPGSKESGKDFLIYGYGHAIVPAINQ